MPNQPISPLTRDTIAAHERLYPRLATLLKQVERVAARRPGQAVTEESFALSGELCREAEQVLGQERRRGKPKGAAPETLDQAGLAMRLGQAMAGLEAFEAANTSYSGRYGAVCWILPDGALQPVSRLKPKERLKGPFGGQSEIERQQDKERIAKVKKRLVERENFAYLQGYHDAQRGKPPRTPHTDFEPIS